MFCAVSQNYQHLFEKQIKKIKHASHGKLSKKLKYSIKILVGLAIVEFLTTNYFDCFDP